MAQELYNETDGYDADHGDESQFCIHGTFIGSWWGPDYMCGYCENGISLEDYQKEQEYAHQNQGILTTIVTVGDKTSSYSHHRIWRNKIPETYADGDCSITYEWKSYAEIDAALDFATDFTINEKG